MALNDLFKSEATKSIAVGVAAAAAAMVVAPMLAKVGRPFARAAVKTGVIFYEKTRETAAEVGEVMEDLVAEARAELEKDEIAETPPRETTQSGKQPSEGVQLKIE